MCNWRWKGHASDGDSIWNIICSHCCLWLDISLVFTLLQLKRCTRKEEEEKKNLNAAQHCYCYCREEEKNPNPNSLNCSKTVARFNSNRQHTNHTQPCCVFARQSNNKQNNNRRRCRRRRHCRCVPTTPPAIIGLSYFSTSITRF